MTIGILKELDDTRVAIVPAIAKKIIDRLKVDVIIEDDAGRKARFYNDQYAECGVAAKSKAEVLAEADILISINPVNIEDYNTCGSGKIVMALFTPFNDASIIDKLKAANVKAFSLDMFPRTTLAQHLDVQSSQASIAGYQAVIMAAYELPVFFPMLITAAGSIPPAKVLVLGTGVAGLQAIATAHRLGAKVEAFDVRKDTKEEVESLGAKFIHVEGSAEDVAHGGYAVEQKEDFKKRQREIIHERAIRSDVIICTARLRGKKAPILIEAETVWAMKRGAVIVDLAADSGGNCALTENKQSILYSGVVIIGDSSPESRMQRDASTMFSNNVFNFLSMLIEEGELNIDEEHEFIKSTLITNN